MKFTIKLLILFLLLAAARCTSVDEASPVSPRITSTATDSLVHVCEYTRMGGEAAEIKIRGEVGTIDALDACNRQLSALKIGYGCHDCRVEGEARSTSEPWTCSCSAKVVGPRHNRIERHSGTWPAWNSGAATSLCEQDLKKKLDIAHLISCYYNTHCTAPSHPDGVTEPGTCRETDPNPEFRKWWCHATLLCQSIPNKGNKLVKGASSAASKRDAAEQTAKTMAAGNARNACKQLGGEVAPWPPKFRCDESESEPPWYGDTSSL